MYEKTIAQDFKVYQVTATATPTKVYDLLSAHDQADLNAMLSSETRRSAIVDGTLGGDADLEMSHSVTAATVIIAADESISLPIYDWVNKVYIQTASTATVSVLVYIS